MTLDEAIKHCEELAEKNEEECKNWTYGASQINDDENRKKQYQKHAEWWHERAKEHRQIAEWLRELKALREFAHYVANSITAEEEEFDENPRFFGEVYCRKLHKLGIIKNVDNKWVYEEEIDDDETRFPYIEGELAEMFVDNEWIKGRIVNGYRFCDGVVTIETNDGKRYWCGQDRTELYRPFKEVNADDTD